MKKISIFVFLIFTTLILFSCSDKKIDYSGYTAIEETSSVFQKEYTTVVKSLTILNNVTINDEIIESSFSEGYFIIIEIEIERKTLAEQEDDLTIDYRWFKIKEQPLTSFNLYGYINDKHTALDSFDKFIVEAGSSINITIIFDVPSDFNLENICTLEIDKPFSVERATLVILKTREQLDALTSE